MTTATATATATASTEPKFLVRFDRIWEALRQYQVREGLCWTFLVTVLALGALALADYWFELPLTARESGSTLRACSPSSCSGMQWSYRCAGGASPERRPKSNRVFPSLASGSGPSSSSPRLPEERIHSEGVAPSLVAALSEDTQVQARSLPLDVIIPWRRAGPSRRSR